MFILKNSEIKQLLKIKDDVIKGSSVDNILKTYYEIEPYLDDKKFPYS